MTELILPNRSDGSQPAVLKNCRQITLIGANGSGKTRFMKDMISRYSGKAYVLSAMSAFYPERNPSNLEGSIDMLYAKATAASPYLKDDAVCELDKLAYMLLNDEFQYLISAKAEMLLDGVKQPLKPTRLDKLINLWQKIFPDNQILKHSGHLMFSTASGDNLISTMSLSSGEKAVLYYIAATLYAMPQAIIFIDSPSLFLHPSILNTIWNAIEALRPDCTFVYNTSDVEFVNSRTENTCVWIKNFDVAKHTWNYEVFDNRNISEDMFIDLIGTRKPVLFIEGDAIHSIDSKLYPLVFPEYTVRPLGSCNKVIESTRTFNDLKYMHHLDSRGIVDRDRRTSSEVTYLRHKNIFVPDVAEIENMFLMEDIIRIMARRRSKDPDLVFGKVFHNIMCQFEEMYKEQALLHVRHKVKREVEVKIDARFTSIGQLEAHMRHLVTKINPRDSYENYCREFEEMLRTGDYQGVLRVFNHKPMLPDSNVAQHLGYNSKDAYIAGVLSVLKGNGDDANALRKAFKHCFETEEATVGNDTDKPVVNSVRQAVNNSMPNNRQNNGYNKKSKKKYPKK